MDDKKYRVKDFLHSFFQALSDCSCRNYPAKKYSCAPTTLQAMATVPMVALVKRVSIFVVLLVGISGFVLPILAHADTYGSGAYGGDVYSASSTQSTTGTPTLAGGSCLNCKSTSSADSSHASVAVSQSTTLSSTTSISSSGTSSSPIYQCVSTDQETSGLVNLFVSLGIIPNDKAQAACDALTLPPNTPRSAFFQFTHALKLGQRTDDVRRLQALLNSHGFVVTREGPGAPGNESDFFGVLTFDAVKRFQAAYKDEILTPIGLTTPSGFFGQSTMKTANAILRGEYSPAVWGLPLVP